MRSIKLLNKKQVEIFLEFVEIRTKIASIVPMSLGILWSIYRYNQLNWLNTLFFILAVLSFDMCTTAINNTMDYFKAINHHYKENENVIGVYQLTPRKMVYVVLSLLGIALIFSFILVYLTDPILILMGGLCFMIGILYTFGPTPISRTPYGELFSGVTMGFGIFFLAVFVNQPDNLIHTEWVLPTMSVTWNWVMTLEIVLMSLPIIAMISNIMLANNLCDYEMDINNERFTLVHYIGKKWGVRLYQILSLLAWLCWVLYIISEMLPFWSIIGLAVAYFHWQSVMRFSAKQIKRETFVEAITSFKLFSSMYALVLIFAIIFK